MTGTGNAFELYGRSLYDLAREEDAVDEIMAQMEGLKAIFAGQPDYLTLLSEPSVPRRQRIELVDEAIGGEVHPYLLNFVKILLENGMLRGFSSCLRAYRSCWMKDSGITEARVVSAAALDDGQAARLKARLEEISGQQVIMDMKVDPSVLGGIRVELDGRLLDGTVEGRLADLRKKVMGTVL